MTLNQISVFLENKPGKLELLTAALAQNSINMRALSLAETSDFGIARIIADDAGAASAVLIKEGFIHTISKVLGAAIPDEPGGLNQVLHILAEAGMNVEYMYAFLGGQTATHAYMIFHVQDAEDAVSALAAAGIACLRQQDLTGL